MSLNATNLFIQAAPLPATFRGSPNDLFAEMIKRMKILSPSGTNFIFIGDTAPTSNVGPWLKNGTQWWVWDPGTKVYVPQDISASLTIPPQFLIGATTPADPFPPVWLKTSLNPTQADPNNYGAAIRWYTFSDTYNQWIAQNDAVELGVDRRIVQIPSEAAVWSYDGGDGSDPSVNIPSGITGAMWEVDHDFDFRMPVGAATNVLTYNGNAATVIAPGSAGGVEKHTLTQNELATHDHGLGGLNVMIATVLNPAVFVAAGGPTVDVATAAAVGNSEAHQNMPPFRGVYFIKRTARQFYVG